MKFYKQFLKINLFFPVSTGKNIFQSKPQPMRSEQQLCWLNSSVQLVFSNSLLVEALLQSPFFMSAAQNTNVNQISTVSNTQEDNKELFKFYTIVEQCTIKYLINILKSPTNKPLGILDINKYIDDLRQHGPKIYLLSTQKNLPIFQPIGSLSSVKEYLSYVLLDTIAHFIDAVTIYHSLQSCSKCHSINITASQRHLLFPLPTTDCDGLLLPNAALQKHFLSDNNNDNNQICYTCGAAPDKNHFSKEIVQLPDALFMSFIEHKVTEKSEKQVKPAEYFIQNHLDMSAFASSQLICSPSYLKYQLKSVIITVTDKKDNDHYYTFAKYGEQFYRCNDELIEPVDKSVVFERKYSSTIAMYMREKSNCVNFVETISQILSEIQKLNLSDISDNTHVRMMFDAALELVVRHTKVLSWSYGAVYTCLHCKEREF